MNALLHVSFLASQSGLSVTMPSILCAIVIGILWSLCCIYKGRRINQRVKHQKKIEFFLASPPKVFRPDVFDPRCWVVDHELVCSIPDEIRTTLPEPEARFVLWYQAQAKAGNLSQIQLQVDEDECEPSQSELCSSTMKMCEFLTHERPKDFKKI